MYRKEIMLIEAFIVPTTAHVAPVLTNNAPSNPN